MNTEYFGTEGGKNKAKLAKARQADKKRNRKPTTSAPMAGAPTMKENNLEVGEPDGNSGEGRPMVTRGGKVKADEVALSSGSMTTKQKAPKTATRETKVAKSTERARKRLAEVVDQPTISSGKAQIEYRSSSVAAKAATSKPIARRKSQRREKRPERKRVQPERFREGVA